LVGRKLGTGSGTVLVTSSATLDLTATSGVNINGSFTLENAASSIGRGWRLTVYGTLQNDAAATFTWSGGATSASAVQFLGG